MWSHIWNQLRSKPLEGKVVLDSFFTCIMNLIREQMCWVSEIIRDSVAVDRVLSVEAILVFNHLFHTHKSFLQLSFGLFICLNDSFKVLHAEFMNASIFVLAVCESRSWNWFGAVVAAWSHLVVASIYLSLCWWRSRILRVSSSRTFCVAKVDVAVVNFIKWLSLLVVEHHNKRIY